ncbi:thiamine phosphate synthase [Prevotella copri]|nr:thiamine phosphate synthase [Segatella copri]
MPLDSFQLQFISHQNEKMTYLDGIREALAGGCKWIQLRMKGATDEEVRPIALKVKKLCKEQNATFLIDDRVQLVKEVGADGVHLGKNDMPIAEARKILGDDFIIGGTANTFEDVKAHYEAGADYIGCGPFHFTTTKKKLSPILGLEGYHEIIQKMKAENIDIPIVAIGGITKEDIPDIMKTGVNGIALSGSILNAKDPASETHDIMEMMKEFR